MDCGGGGGGIGEEEREDSKSSITRACAWTFYVCACNVFTVVNVDFFRNSREKNIILFGSVSKNKKEGMKRNNFKKKWWRGKNLTSADRAISIVSYFAYAFVWIADVSTCRVLTTVYTKNDTRIFNWIGLKINSSFIGNIKTGKTQPIVLMWWGKDEEKSVPSQPLPSHIYPRGHMAVHVSPVPSYPLLHVHL